MIREKDQYPISNTEHPISKKREEIQKKESFKIRFDLQERLIEYAIKIINIAEKLPGNQTGKHISSQILRSGTSPAPNYGEAQSAESPSDFIHKMKISLKELRETEVWLKIIVRANLIQASIKISPLLQETDELIAIFFKSIDTAKKRKEE